MQLFKLECEIKFAKGRLSPEKISEIKQRLYCLRRDFDNSRLKEKYDYEFRQKYRKVLDALESKIRYRASWSVNEMVTKRANVIKRADSAPAVSRKKRRAPQPPGHYEEIKTAGRRSLVKSNTDIFETHHASQKIEALSFKVEEIAKDVEIFDGGNGSGRCYLTEMLERCLEEAGKIQTDEFAYLEKEKKQCVERIRVLIRQVEEKRRERTNGKLKR